MGKQKAFYLENLDGLRAIAALAVVFFHISTRLGFEDEPVQQTISFIISFGHNSGHLGVYFFFILSGFLITYLMFLEQATFKRFSIPDFYVRRVLRIWPLYFATLLIGFVVHPFLIQAFGGSHTENASFAMYGGFLANFDNLNNGMPTSGILGVQWSVAVEEQFYLVWPLVFVLFTRLRAFPLFSFVVMVGAWACFVLWSYEWKLQYFHLIANMRFLAWGAFLGWLCFAHKGKVIALLTRIGKPLTVMIYVVSLALIFFERPLIDLVPRYVLLRHAVPFAFFAFVILEQCYSPHSLFKLGRFKRLSWLGKISYGLYLTHMIAIVLVMAIFPEGPIYLFPKAVLTLILTIAISHYSYYYFERYFLGFKKRFAKIVTGKG